MKDYRRKSDSKRPVWEPAPKGTTVDLANIETGPSSEEDAMNSLLRQGCHWPPKHYRKDHECRIPGLRLQALRQIKRWEKSRPVLQLMMEKLPDELNLLIMQHVVLDTQQHMHFKKDDTPLLLTEQANSLLGGWEGIDPLIPLAEQAILENSIIKCDVEFQRAATGSEKIAVLPTLIQILPQPLRHLQLQIRFEIPAGRQKYPSAIYTATSGMASLCAQLPGLRSLHLLMLIDLNHAPRDPHRGSGPPILRSCRKGFSGESTFLQAIADLVDAARTARPSVTTTIEIKYEHEYQWYSPPVWKPLPEVMYVEADIRPATDVVREAEIKWE